MNDWDILCDLCIHILENLSRLTGLSYGLINVLFFCILGPLSTVCFMGSTASAVFGRSRMTKKHLTMAFAIVGMICVIAILIPCLWATITL